MPFRECSNCGALVDDSNNYCPKCGAPLYAQEKKKSKKYIWLILLAVVLIGGYFLKREYDSYKYSVNIRDAYIEMATGASDAEAAGGLIHSVWYNSIFQIDDAETNKFTRQSDGTGSFYNDFNDALNLLMEDRSFQLDMLALTENQARVTQLMKELSDPPEKYREQYYDLKNLYGSYNELVLLVLNPTGTLNSFTDDFNEADKNCADYVVSCMYLAT